MCIFSGCRQSGRNYYEGYVYSYKGDIYVYEKHIDAYKGDINAIKGYIDTIKEQRIIQKLRFNDNLVAYIHAVEEQPIQGLRIFPRDGRYFYCADSGGDIMNEDRFRRAKADSAAGVTDENGYFKFKQLKTFSWSFLMIESEREIIDSIEVLYHHLNTRKDHERFVDGLTDTFFIYMNGE
jgi:hypothetical protein